MHRGHIGEPGGRVSIYIEISLKGAFGNGASLSMGALLGYLEDMWRKALETGISRNSKLDWDCLQSFLTEADQNVAQLNLLFEYVAADNGPDMSYVGQEPAQNGQAGCKTLQV